MNERINERIKELRLKLCITQKEFGERLGLSRDAVAAYERGTVKPPKVAIRCICSVFNVNPTWIEEGNGDMFAYAGMSSHDYYLLQELKNSDFLYSLVEMWISTPAAERETIGIFMDSVVSHCSAMRFARAEMQRQDYFSRRS